MTPPAPEELLRWRMIKPPSCDLCDEPAVWRHDEGGLRCAKCRRPRKP